MAELAPKLTPTVDSEKNLVRRRKARNSMAWGVISLFIGLLFGTDAGIGNFRSLVAGLEGSNGSSIGLIVPMIAFLVCLLSVFGEILGEILTQMVWEREKDHLDATQPGKLLHRNILADIVTGLVTLQEKIIPIWWIEQVIGSEILQHVMTAFRKVIALIGGFSGAVFLVAFVRLLGDAYDFSWLYALQIGAFTAALFGLAFTSLPPFSLLLIFGLTFVYNGILTFMGAELAILGILEIVVGGFFLLVFLRALQWYHDPERHENP